MLASVDVAKSHTTVKEIIEVVTSYGDEGVLHLAINKMPDNQKFEGSGKSVSR